MAELFFLKEMESDSIGFYFPEDKWILIEDNENGVNTISISQKDKPQEIRKYYLSE